MFKIINKQNKKEPENQTLFYGATNTPKLELFDFVKKYEKCLNSELIQGLKLLKVA